MNQNPSSPAGAGTAVRETGHTPGPWGVKAGHGDVTIVCNEVLSIASVSVDLPRRPLRVSHANARLIAAAPELLEALRAAAERMEAVAEGIPVENRAEGVSQATHVRHMAGHLAEHAKIARAAIAKATHD